MPRGIPADRTHKAEIVTKIRDQGMSVSEASAQYQLSSKTIYSWLREGVVDGNRNLILDRATAFSPTTSCVQASL